MFKVNLKQAKVKIKPTITLLPYVVTASRCCWLKFETAFAKFLCVHFLPLQSISLIFERKKRKKENKAQMRIPPSIARELTGL
jgi:hypothetical protein